MRAYLLLGCLLVGALAVDPNEQTKAGEQAATASKANGKASIDAQQTGGTKGSGNFNANVANKVATDSKGHKAGVASKSDIYAGTGSNDHRNSVKNTGDGWDTSGKDGQGTASLDIANSRKSNNPKQPVVKTGQGKGFSIDAGGDKNAEYKAEATNLKDSSKVYNIDMHNKENIDVVKQGNKVATVTGINSKDNIVIDHSGKGFNGKVGVKDVGGGMEQASFVKNNNAFGAKKATYNEDGSATEIQNGLAKTSAKLDTRAKKAELRGSLIPGTSTAQWTEATEADCPYSAYADRRAPGDANKPWKYSEKNGFKIFYKEAKVSAQTDKSGSTIKAEWPQCLDVTIPVSFPQGAKAENLALGMAIYFPGCPRFTCAGRVCGLEFSAQGGLPVGEACFTDDLCKLEEVPAAKRKYDVIGYSAGNADTNLCSQGGIGGKKVYIKNTYCQHEEDRQKGYKACPLLNFATDESALRQKVVVIGRLYEKKPCTGFACNFGLNKLVCNIQDYYLHGCREMGTNYHLTAFGLNADDVKYTGIERKSGVSGQTSGSTNTNVDTNTGSGSVSGSGSGSVSGGTATTTTTRAPTTTTRRNPWGNFWGRGRR